MTIIHCPECQKEISDKATVCPNCGFPINVQNEVGNQISKNASERKSNKFVYLILAIVFVVGGLITYFFVRNATIKMAATLAATQRENTQRAATQMTGTQVENTLQAATQMAGTQEVIFQQTATQKAIESEALYKSKFISTAKSIYYLADDCRFIDSSVVAWFWDFAIKQGESVDANIQEWVDAGYQTGLWDKRDKERQQIDEMISSVTPPIEEYENYYEELTKLYGYYIFFSSQEKNPTGSLFTYNQALKEKGSELDTSYSKLSITFPELKICITNIDSCAP